MARVVVIGAGAMGLAAAWQAAKDGHEVDVVEAAPEPGGMAGHFDFDGVSIERFYHFVCHTDFPTFELLRELGMEDKLKWRHTTMGYFDGKLHPWGDPVALLRYPSLTLLEKLRYALFAFVCVRRNSWESIEQESAKSWILRWCGPSIYERFWRPLFDHKFYEFADGISATWIWTRIRRIGRSRSSLLREELGYIEGGTITLVNALIAKIQENGGRLHLGQPVERVTTNEGHVTGVQTAKGHFDADAVIATVPTPYIPLLVPDLSAELKETYAAIPNIGVICVIFKLKRRVSSNFWVNVSVPQVEIPGVIELTNLRDIGGESIVYVPYYMPVTHPKFVWSDEALLAEAMVCLKLINPELREDDVMATRVARLRYGQPVCRPGFASRLPPVQTPIAGLQIADTCFYYPEDRGIAESIRLGRAMARALGTKETMAAGSATIGCAISSEPLITADS